MGENPAMNFTVEHFRAVDAPESVLGFEYVPTGRVDSVEAHDQETAAAIALTSGDDPPGEDVVSYDPSHDLYGVAGEDEAVRVAAA
jgi:hypothetical protein